MADHVMLFLPPNVIDGVAKALYNHWLSVYNDIWTLRSSAQIHELGHNLGLKRSADYAYQYGDLTDLMGLSYPENDTRICFNGAKSWILDQYRGKSLSLRQRSQMPNGRSNIVDYPIFNNMVIVRLKQPRLLPRWYVSFNCAKGFNSGTREAANKVGVHEAIPGTNSMLHATLGAGQSYRPAASKPSFADLPGWNGNPNDALTISVNDGSADITIRFMKGSSMPSTSPSQHPTTQPSTLPSYSLSDMPSISSAPSVSQKSK